jgi:regulator of replication initiation timing
MSDTVETLKAQLKALAEENATLRYERDLARAELSGQRPEATPEQESEFRRQIDGGSWLDFEEVVASLSAELRGGHGQ